MSTQIISHCRAILLPAIPVLQIGRGNNFDNTRTLLKGIVKKYEKPVKIASIALIFMVVLMVLLLIFIAIMVIKR